MTTIHVDGTAYEVAAEKNLLETLLSLGFDMPYFCWHPALGSVGACRQCAVVQYKDADDTEGRLTMACMTTVEDGARFSVAAAQARGFRRQVIEWMMRSHPHDCPVCDEGGECHLQDMTVMTGHRERRSRGRKRTFVNQDLGPLLAHEMNRCITCFRCVRFYNDYAGDTDLTALGSRDRTYFGRVADGPLESPFAGNLVEVCPTGVFTDASYRQHYVRKWDLQATPTVCPHCAVGCNTLTAEREGVVRRVTNRYHPDINGYFLCDRGRYGYGHLNTSSATASAARGADGQTLAADEALGTIAAVVAEGAPLLGVGSPRASLEGNHTLRRLVGGENFFVAQPAHRAGAVAALLRLQTHSTIPQASLRDMSRADAVVVLGADLGSVAPRAALSLRQCRRHLAAEAAKAQGIPPWQDESVRVIGQTQRNPLFIADTHVGWLDAQAGECWYGPPAALADIAHALARRLDTPDRPLSGALEPKAQTFIERAAVALQTAERPLVVTGSGCGDATVADAAAEVVQALGRLQRDGARWAVFTEQPNDAGLGLFGGRPAEALPAAADGAVVVAADGDLDAVLGPAEWERLRRRARALVVLDCKSTGMTAAADLWLPSAAPGQQDGTYVNFEGRAQRSFRGQADTPRPAWHWLGALGAALGREDLGALRRYADVSAALETDFPALAPLNRWAESLAPLGRVLARQTPRYSGRTALAAPGRMHEPAPPQDTDSAYAFSMEGAFGPELGGRTGTYQAAGWNSNEALTRFQEEVDGPLRETAPRPRLRPLSPPPAAESSGPGEAGPWLAVPEHQLFGEEPLEREAAFAPSPSATVGLGPDDVAGLGVTEGQRLRLRHGHGEIELRVCARGELPPGLVTVPARWLPGGGVACWVELDVPEQGG